MDKVMTPEEIELIHTVDIYTRHKLLPKCEEADYLALHTNVLLSTSIKLDVPLFRSTMDRYADHFKPWSKNRPEMHKIRKGLALVNLTGHYIDDEDPTIGPLDYYNKMNPDKPLLENDIITPTEILEEKCFEPLSVLRPHLVRSSILKWELGANFFPHIDVELPTQNLRLWGTDNPESIKVRFKNENNEYAEVPNVEAGRLYIIDTAKYHDAICTSTMGYQFFISVGANAYNLLKQIKIAA